MPFGKCLIEGRYPAYTGDITSILVVEAYEGLEPGTKVYSIGAPGKSGKFTSSHRLAEFDPPLKYAGTWEGQFDEEMEASKYALFEVHPAGVSGFDLFSPQVPVYLVFIQHTGDDGKPTLLWQDYKALNCYMYPSIFNKKYPEEVVAKFMKRRKGKVQHV